MTILFCDYWDYATQSPGEVLDVNEALKMLRAGTRVDGAGDWSGIEGEPPAFSFEAYPNTGLGASILVYNYDPAGSIATLTEFDEVDGRLFLREAIDYEYSEDGRRHLRADATRMVTTRYTPDGTVRLEIDDDSEPTREVREFRDVDVSQHWERFPEKIEDFVRIGRLETFLADK